jgi:hypothetical protein
MSDLLAWPALHPGKTPLPEEIRYERGVWGKVHAARTDFRWIARSGGFAREGPDLELGRQISLGAEDQPVQAQLWRSLDDRCLAVGLYPSRSVDAGGRTSFLEKQVLAWSRTPEVPAALAALLLLPHVETLTDDVWWTRHGNQPWGDPAFSLPIPPSEPLSIRLDQLDKAVQQGVSELRDSVEPSGLQRLYAQIVAGRCPAWLTGLDRPLSPRALAVLLLPLPRALADSLSLAGWIPSGRVSVEDLTAARWGVLVLPPHLRDSVGRVEEAHPKAEAQGWALAQGLLNLDLDLVRPAAYAVVTPSPEPEEEKKEDEVRPAKPEPPPPLSPLAALRPRAEIPLLNPPANSALLRELYAFAKTVDRRWLDLDSLGIQHLTRLEEIPERLFPSWIETLREQKPEHANAEQWTVKLDLLRSAALVLRPGAGTLRAVGLPESRRVPALLFALLLDKRELLVDMGEEILSQALKQSLSCLPDPRARKVRDWLVQWKPKRSSLGALLARELAAAVKGS